MKLCVSVKPALAAVALPLLFGGCVSDSLPTNAEASELENAANLVGLNSACRVVSEYKSYEVPPGTTTIKRRSSPHAGIDYGCKAGTPIFAVADGEVAMILGRGCGKGVSLLHKEHELYTTYCHASKVLVVKGQKVKQGDVIALVGRTGGAGGTDHLHFEVDLTVHAMGEGSLGKTRDPKQYTVGCFDLGRPRNPDRFEIILPVPCGGANL